MKRKFAATIILEIDDETTERRDLNVPDEKIINSIETYLNDALDDAVYIPMGSSIYVNEVKEIRA